MEHPANAPTETGTGDKTDDKQRLRRELQEKIRSHQARSMRGMWAFAAFLAVSIGAWNDFRFLPSLPDNIGKLLGAAPSANMISGLLVLYSFSSIILILSRMMSGSGPSRGFVHVAYLAVFYGFYHLAGSLGDNYWAVLAAGVTILALESYHNWFWFSRLVREEQETLRKLEKDGNRFGAS